MGARALPKEFRSKSDTIKYRICFYCIALTHLVAVGFYMLTIDFSLLEDHELKKYNNYKWKLFTTWFNVS